MEPVEDEHPHQDLVRDAAPCGQRLQFLDRFRFQRHAGREPSFFLEPFSRGEYFSSSNSDVALYSFRDFA